MESLSTNALPPISACILLAVSQGLKKINLLLPQIPVLPWVLPVKRAFLTTIAALTFRQVTVHHIAP
jgi:hypothetical protein